MRAQYEQCTLFKHAKYIIHIYLLVDMKWRVYFDFCRLPMRVKFLYTLFALAQMIIGTHSFLCSNCTHYLLFSNINIYKSLAANKIVKVMDITNLVFNVSEVVLGQYNTIIYINCKSKTSVKSKLCIISII